MKSRGWIFGLLTLLVIPLVDASLSGKIGSLWNKILYVGGLGFLNLPGSNDIVLFLRFAIGLLVFTILFALGVLAGSNQAQFLNRQHAAVIAGIISVITMIFIPSAVLIAISASFGTLVSLILLATPLVAMVLLAVYLPDDPCGWNAAKTALAAMILWILNLQQVHISQLTGPNNYIPVNEAIDWAAFIALIFFIYYLIKWISCALGGNDDGDGGPDFGEGSPLRKLFDKITGKGKDDVPDGSSGSGNEKDPDFNKNVPTPGTGAAGDLGEETRSMFELILKKINELSIDMNKRFTDVEVWLQTLNQNVKLNSNQIAKFESYLETIKKDLLKEIKEVVHDEIQVLHDEIKKIRTEMQVIQQETHKFISSKHKEHIREIHRIERDLVQRHKKLIRSQEKIIESIKEITSKIEKLERESVRTETVKVLIERIKEIQHTIAIIEAERVGIDRLDIDAVIQLLRKLELKINIEINNNNNNNNNNNGGGSGGKRKPRGTAALEFVVNGKEIKDKRKSFDLRRDGAFTHVKLHNSGTGGIITYHIIARKGLRVNAESLTGILVVGQHVEFTIEKNGATTDKDTQDITIYAKEGNHSSDEKGWRWFHKNKRWHYELNFKIN